MNETEIRRGSCGVLVCEGRILLGRRSPSARSHHGQWDVIGGHHEAGETDEQTMVRELREELSVVPTIYKCVGVLSEKFVEAQFLLHVFSVKKWDGTPTNCSDEHIEIAWFLPSEIPKLDLTSLSLVGILSKIASE